MTTTASPPGGRALPGPAEVAAGEGAATSDRARTGGGPGVTGVRSSRAGELRVVGQALARLDQAERVAGTTRYAGDFALPGMAHARLVRSPLPSARITRRDASKALALPGALCVLFGEDVPHNTVWVDVPGQTVEVAALKASMEVLATSRVRFHGEPVALVVA